MGTYVKNGNSCIGCHATGIFPDGCLSCANLKRGLFTSNAEWPAGTIAGGCDISTDNHDTEAQAQGVCRGLMEKGFGGEGRIFPVRTWVEDLTKATV